LKYIISSKKVELFGIRIGDNFDFKYTIYRRH
jgi:hypothetical protein